MSDRTNRLVRSFHSELKEDSLRAFSRFSIALAGNREILSTFDGQVVALGVVNEVARFHPQLRNLIPDGITTKVDFPFGYHPDLSRCADNVMAIIQSGAGLASPPPDGPVDILISVGRSSIVRSRYEIIVNSNGWNAFVCAEGDVEASYLSKPSDNTNPIGALAAASFASADAFRRIVELLGADDRRIRKKYKDLKFSALDFSLNDRLISANPPLPNRIDLGKICLVGAGAVGNGVIYALFMANRRLSGQIGVIDYQNYAPTDLNRCLMIEPKRIPGEKATELISPFKNLSSTNLQLRAYSGRYETSDMRKERLELVISTVDENPPRFAIQTDLPRVLLHGATGEQICTTSRHGFLDGACLGCLFFDTTDPLSMRISKETGLDVHRVEKLLSDAVVTGDDVIVIASKTGLNAERLYAFVGKPLQELYAKEVCGAVTVQVGEEEIAASVSFISALAGILLAGEVLKERVSELARWRLNNHVSMSLFNPSSRWLQERPKDERCSCLCSSEIMIEAYKRKWSDSNGVGNQK